MNLVNDMKKVKENNKLPGWHIEVIDDKLKDGAYLEDSREASAHLFIALRLDPTLVGTGQIKSKSA